MGQADTATLEAPQSSSPTPPAGGESSGVVITPELQAKFQEVMGPAHSAPAASPRPGRSPAQRMATHDSAQDELALAADQREGEGQDAGAGAADRPPMPQGGRPAVKEGSAPTLPAALRHAAKRNGWSDEEIDQLAGASPDLAERTVSRLHQSYNQLSTEFARLGQARAGQPPQAPNQPRAAQAPAASQEDDLLQALYGERMEAFADRYGSEFVKDVLEPLVAPIKEMRGFLQQQEMKAVAAEANSFWDGLGGEFADLYGAKGKVEESHQQSREQLAMLADQIRTGAAAQGIRMSVTEALERAHLIHAAEHMETIERKRITGSLHSRSAARTARPFAPRRPGGLSSAPEERSIASAVEAYQQRVAELGLGT